MWTDPIVNEVRKHRAAYAEAFDYDVAAICRDLRKQQAESGGRVMSLPARKVELSQASAQEVKEVAEPG